MIKLSKRTLIQSNKDILGGEPVFRGTRVPVKTLMEYLEKGDSLGDFLNDFPTVTRQQAVSVIQWVKESFSK